MYFLNSSKTTVCRKLKQGKVFHISMLSFVLLASHQLQKEARVHSVCHVPVISLLFPAPACSVWARRQPGPLHVLETPNASDQLPVPPRSLQSRGLPGVFLKEADGFLKAPAPGIT